MRRSRYFGFPAVVQRRYHHLAGQHQALVQQSLVVRLARRDPRHHRVELGDQVVCPVLLARPAPKLAGDNGQAGHAPQPDHHQQLAQRKQGLEEYRKFEI